MMAFQVLINTGMAFVWLFLQNKFTFLDFCIGYVIGFGLLFLLRRFLKEDLYIVRFVPYVKLIYIFIRELTLANIDLLKIILRPKMDIKPGIVALPTKLESNWEITLLASLITLTPGTLSMTFSEDSTVIYVHVVHIEDKEETIAQIKDTFEKAIMEVSG